MILQGRFTSSTRASSSVRRVLLTTSHYISSVEPLLHHLIHVSTQQAEHQGVDQHTDLSGLALSVSDIAASQGQLAGQIIGHGVRNQEKEDEARNLRHLVLYSGKKFGRL